MHYSKKDVKDINTFTQELAKSTAKILLKYFRHHMQVQHKKNSGIVTTADLSAEKHILQQINKHYPFSRFIAEESKSTHHLRECGEGLTWVIDPLDGTSNYASGIGWFCISIGTVLDDNIVSGVIYNPITQEMFSAYLGGGAYLNKKKIVVSTEKKLKDLVLSTGFYYMRSKELHREIKRFETVINEVRAVRRFGSAALDIAYTAAGRYDGFFEIGLSPWDVAAGMIIADEAGAVTTNYRGKPTNIFEKSLVITNGKFHSALLKLLK